MPVTEHPVHRSVRAELPQAAPALGCDDQTLIRARVADISDRKPMGNDSMYFSPAQLMGLAAPTQCAVPQSPDLEAECAQRGPLQDTPKYRPSPAATARR